VILCLEHLIGKKGIANVIIHQFACLQDAFFGNKYFNILLFCTLFCRKVTITGSQRAIRAAESMIMQKVAYASERVMD